MTNMLPPTRDLPPGRQARIRADLERAVSGRRSSKRYLVPILAGATAVTAVVTSVVLLQPNTDPKPAEQTPAPAPKVRDTFGLTPEQVAAIEQGCAKPEDVSDKLTLHQFSRDDAGQGALLYTDRVVVACNLDRGGEEYDTDRPKEVFINWLPGHFSMDISLGRLGGDLHRNPPIPAMAGVPGLRLVAGRVDSSVTRMTYRGYDGRTVEAKIANGTYVVRIAYPSTWNPNDVPSTAELRAYDAAGNLLGTNTDLAGTCYYAPDSKEIIHGERGVTADKCKPATPWR